MATPRGQRIGIWIIAIVMTAGTLGSFLAMILSVKNSEIDQANFQKEQIENHIKDLESFSPKYSSRSFNEKEVTELKVEILEDGDGEIVKETDSINASYFGWLSNGKIFDSSKKKSGKEDMPVTFPLSNVVSGWSEGLSGVKVGSIVRLTVPSEKAYGANGAPGGLIPADAALEFIIQIHKIDNNEPQEP